MRRTIYLAQSSSTHQFFPSSVDYLRPPHPFIHPTAPIAIRWEALSFASDKTIQCLLAGGQASGVSKVPLAASPTDQTAARQLLATHLSDYLANSSTSESLKTPPADPWMRQNYLNVLHSLIIGCTEQQPDVVLQVLAQVGTHFTWLMRLS